MSSIPTPLQQVVLTLVSLVRNIHLKRALTQADPDPALNFWRVIRGNLIDVAVLEWCKLFGSDHQEHQRAHWKNMVPELDHEQFRSDLFASIGIDRATWDQYREHLKTYRDTHVAHFDLSPGKTANLANAEGEIVYPQLDLALSSAYFYYDWMKSDCLKRGEPWKYPDDIDSYGQAFLDQTKAIAVIATSATSKFHETVR